MSRTEPRSVLPPRRRRGYGGLLGSVLAHLLLLAILLATIEHDWQSASARGAAFEPARGGGGGGGGGGGYIALPELPRAEHPAPVPQARPTPPPEATVPVEAPAPPPPDSTPPPAAGAASAPAPSGGEAGTGPGTGGGAGGGAGTGVGPGTGAGTGPGTGGGGAGGTGRKAESRRLILPPMESAPKDLRGQPLAVTFWVSATGKVLRLEVQPEIRDKGYARKFADAMRGYEFRPARGPDGAPVADTVTVVVVIN